MQQLLNDRRVLVPMLLTAIVIAVGAVGIVVLTDDASTGASASQSGASAAQSQGAAGGAVTVEMADFKFMPMSVSVKAGGKVSWIERDDAPHTATASGGFDTGTLQKGEKKTLTFAKPGTYPYICALHPFMKGTVVVT